MIKKIKKIILKCFSNFLEIAMHYNATNKFEKITRQSNVNIHNSFFKDEETGFIIDEHCNEFTIEKNVSCRKFSHFLVYPHASLIIKENVFFNNYCSINCLGRIEIGANTIFGEGVKLYDHNHKHNLVAQNISIERNEFNISSITIGKNCWIGSNVTILKGVTIGDNVIIGANCLIFKSIPTNTIVKHQEGLIFLDATQAYS